jgi:hypothetical protein
VAIDHRRGVVFIAWSELFPERGFYSGYWDGGPEGFLEQMPETPSIDAALEWGRERSDRVKIRPSWDSAHYYEGGSVPMPGERVLSDHRWTLLELARRPLVTAFADDGVTRVEYTAAFPSLDGFAVWLCTDTDTQRDALGMSNPRLEQIRQVLASVGFGTSELMHSSSTAQSQETVDRDYQGSWFSAMR